LPRTNAEENDDLRNLNADIFFLVPRASGIQTLLGFCMKNEAGRAALKCGPKSEAISQ
jgi:hypothetical protein